MIGLPLLIEGQALCIVLRIALILIQVNRLLLVLHGGVEVARLGTGGGQGI